MQQLPNNNFEQLENETYTVQLSQVYNCTNRCDLHTESIFLMYKICKCLNYSINYIKLNSQQDLGLFLMCFETLSNVETRHIIYVGKTREVIIYRQNDKPQPRNFMEKPQLSISITYKYAHRLTKQYDVIYKVEWEGREIKEHCL